jgi:hypothetical protein
MFNSFGSILGFLVGLALTVGLLVSPHLFPWGYRLGMAWTLPQLVLAFAGGLAVLGATLWLAGRLIKGAQSWKELRVMVAAVLIAGIANTLYSVMVELFALNDGWRALIAALGVPVIYGNLSAVLGKTTLKVAMLNILQGALATLGAGFVIAAIMKGW